MTDADLRDLIDRVTDHLLANGGRERAGSDEIRFQCPSPEHRDEHASCDWNRRSGVYNCLSCGSRGGAVALARLLDLPLSNGTPAAAPGSGRRGQRRETTGGEASPSSPPIPAVPLPDEERWQRLVNQLVTSDYDVAEEGRAFLSALGIDPATCGWGLGYLSDDDLERHRLPRGADGVRFLVPVRDPETGDLVDVRRYAPGLWGNVDDRLKCVPWSQGTGSAAPYGWHDLPTDADTLVWCEGEKDRETALALGFAAVSHTNGAGSAAKVARELPLALLTGRRVAILFDHDEPGRTHGRKLADVLGDRGIPVAILAWPTDSPKGFDVADAVTRDGAEVARTLIRWQLDSAEWLAPGAEIPVIATGGRQLSAVADEAIEVLRTANEPPTLFVRSGQIVRVQQDENNWPIIVTVGTDALLGRLARVAAWTGSQGRPVHPPKIVAQTVLVEPKLPFPALEGVTQVPTLRPDGTVLDRSGYDAATRLVYSPPPNLQVPATPDHPSRAEVAAARAVVADVLADFPFVDQASRANTWALWLTPVIRAAIEGPVPLACIDAPAPGTGKSLLAEVISIVATGRAEFSTAPDTDDEWRKRITSLLLSGSTILAFDNVPSHLRSDPLAAAITADWWSDRLLGQSVTIRARQRATWIATGNNLAVGGDLPRRCYWIRLDAQVSRPWERDGFRIADLRGYVTRHRGEILGALLTIARAWYDAGKPTTEVRRLGGFEHWTETVAGILAYTGVNGFLGNQAEMYDQADEDGPVWEAFLRAWQRCFGSEPVRTAAVIEAMGEHGVPSADDLRESCPPWALGRDGQPDARRLGNSFKRYLDRRYGSDSIRLTKASVDGHAKVGMWAVLDDAGSAESGGSIPSPPHTSEQQTRNSFTTRTVGKTPQVPADPAGDDQQLPGIDDDPFAR